MRTVVKYQKSGPGNIPIEGRYSFNIKHPTAVVFGYEAPAKDFQERLPTLLTIIANITILDPEAYQRLSPGQGKARRPTLPMKQTTARDGTCQLLVPQGWNLTAEKGRALCATPDGDTGFIFTTDRVRGQISDPQFRQLKNPRSSLQLHAAGRCSGCRLEASRVKQPSHPGTPPQSGLDHPENARRRSPCFPTRARTAFPASGISMSWAAIPMPPDYGELSPWAFGRLRISFARSLPSLIQIMESFQINQQWAADQVRQGMEKVRELMKKTSSMMSKYAEEMRQSSLAAPSESDEEQ